MSDGNADIDRLADAARQALRQWKMYADVVEGGNGFDLETDDSPEGELYRFHKAALAAYEGKEKG